MATFSASSESFFARSFQHIRTRFAVFPLAALLLAACATPRTEETSRPDPLSPSPHQIIGHVAMVDPDSNLAVIDLRRQARNVSGRLTARNEILRETATLEPTGQRRGQSLGVRILSGLPNLGDEVVIERD